MSDLDPAGLEAAAKALQADRGAPTTHAGRYDSHRATVAVRAYLAAVLPPDEENPYGAGRHCGEDCRGCKAASIWAQGFAAGRTAASPDPPRTVLDPETGIEEPVTTGRIPDAEFVEPPLMPPAASPDERLREAGDRLAQAVARVCGEGHPALAAWRVALAAATPDPPDESHAVKCAEARGYARGRFERDPAASPDPPDLPALDEGPLAYLLEDSAASPDERLREALAFYADKGNYTAQNPVGSGAHVWRDMGQRARAALAADRDSLAEKPETDT